MRFLARDPCSPCWRSDTCSTIDARADRKIRTADSDALRMEKAVHSEPRRMIRVLLSAMSVVVAGMRVDDTNHFVKQPLLGTLQTVVVCRTKRWMPKGWWEAGE